MNVQYVEYPKYWDVFEADSIFKSNLKLTIENIQ